METQRISTPSFRASALHALAIVVFQFLLYALAGFLEGLIGMKSESIGILLPLISSLFYGISLETMKPGILSEPKYRSQIAWFTTLYYVPFVFFMVTQFEGASIGVRLATVLIALAVNYGFTKSGLTLAEKNRRLQRERSSR